ncbi:hypothetical protein OG217_33885 [Streptomyces sp. NBC_01023]|nr:hypothetical protein OG217_33885 [Streptomyces sp. NBC_01023]
MNPAGPARNALCRCTGNTPVTDFAGYDFSYLWSLVPEVSRI